MKNRREMEIQEKAENAAEKEITIEKFRGKKVRKTQLKYKLKRKTLIKRAK